MAFYNRGVTYDNKRQYDRAIQDYTSAIALKPDYGSALDNRCWARASLGVSLDMALADSNADLKLRPGHVDTLNCRAFVHYRMGQFDNAKADAMAALKVAPKSWVALYLSGLAKRGLGDTAGADADIAAARTIFPKAADKWPPTPHERG